MLCRRGHRTRRNRRPWRITKLRVVFRDEDDSLPTASTRAFAPGWPICRRVWRRGCEEIVDAAIFRNVPVRVDARAVIRLSATFLDGRFSQNTIPAPPIANLPRCTSEVGSARHAPMSTDTWVRRHAVRAVSYAA